MMQQQTYLLELYRAGLRTASDIAKASFENAQRMHTQQLEALREALDANTRSAQRLS